MKEPRKKITVSSVMFLGLTLFLTAALFVGLVMLQGFLLEEVTYQQVLVAKTNIPQNLVITEENADKYFTLSQRNVIDITKGSLSDTSELIGKKAYVSLYEGEVVALKDFEAVDEYKESLKNPVEISIKIDEISNAVGGKLREGDLINISMMFTKNQLGLYESTSGTSSIQNSLYDNQTSTDLLENASESTDEITLIPSVDSTPKTEIKYGEFSYTNQSKHILKNVRVSRVLDSAGTQIEPTDVKSSASIIFFYIDGEIEADVNNALTNCSSLRISRSIQNGVVREQESEKENEK